MTTETRPSPTQSYAIPVVIVLTCFAAWALGGVLTRPNLAWYATLDKPGFTPPNETFPVVWTILFAVMALSGWLAWRSPGEEEDRRAAFGWFLTQLAIGVVWSYAFFWLQSPGLGLVVVLLLLVAIVITIVYFDRLSRPAALLLLPYVLWVAFAASLNFAIWFLNR